MTNTWSATDDSVEAWDAAPVGKLLAEDYVSDAELAAAADEAERRAEMQSDRAEDRLRARGLW